MTHIEIAIKAPQGTGDPLLVLSAFPMDGVRFAKLANGRCQVIVHARGFPTAVDTYEDYATVIARLGTSPSGNVAVVSSGDRSTAESNRTSDLAIAEG